MIALRTAAIGTTVLLGSVLSSTTFRETITLPPGSIISLPLPNGVTVKIPDAPPVPTPKNPAVALTFDATPLSLVAGQPVDLGWQSPSVSGCTASGGWDGPQAP